MPDSTRLSDIPPERQDQLRRQLEEMEEVRIMGYPVNWVDDLDACRPFHISQSDDDWNYREVYNQPR